MAWVEKYPTNGGDRWRVRYRRPDGGETSKRGFRTKREATAFANTTEVRKLRGEYVAPALGRVTIDTMAANWLHRKEIDLKPSTYRTTETAWRVHV